MAALRFSPYYKRHISHAKGYFLDISLLTQSFKATDSYS